MLCTAGAAICSPQKSIDVRKSIVIVLSSSYANIVINGGKTIDLPPDGTLAAFTVSVLDRNGNPMPAGTQVKFATTNGILVTDPSYVVPNTTAPSAGKTRVSMQTDKTDSFGALTVTVTAPSGAVTTASTMVQD